MVDDQHGTDAHPRRPLQHGAPGYRSASAYDAMVAARYTGWKPIVIWYALLAILFAVGGVGALASGNVGGFLLGVVLSGLAAKYSLYLYRGGRRRVWFVFF